MSFRTSGYFDKYPHNTSRSSASSQSRSFDGFWSVSPSVSLDTSWLPTYIQSWQVCVTNSICPVNRIVDIKAFAQAESKATRALVIIIALLHAALALTLKVLFFSYYIVKQIGVKDPLGGETGDEVPGLLF